MPGGVLLQELLPKGRCARPLLSSHSAFFSFLSLCYIEMFLSAHLLFHLEIIPSLPTFLPVSLHSLCLVFYLSSFLSLKQFFFLPALPSQLRHQLYTHRSCFHGVSQRFWQSALETQDHFK